MEEVEICIPARDEEIIIIPTLAALLAICDSHPEYTWKITVIDNGSRDNTAHLVESHSDPRVHLEIQPREGKGAAVSFGASKSTADYLGYIDADLSAAPESILELLSYVKDGADIAVGSRMLATRQVNRSIWRTLTARIFQLYAGLLVPVPVADSQCGLKLMNKRGIEILALCQDPSWFFDREFLAKAHKRGYNIVEVPIAWEEFRYAGRRSKLRVFQAAMKSLRSLWHIRVAVQKFK